ncbi:MAG: hypothetical protein ACLFTR_05260 [Candidatus Woesearchaeota archaeon]
MAEKNLFTYDEGDDSLTFINSGLEGDHTIDTGFMLITLDKEGKVSALELMGAKKNFKMDDTILSNLSRANVDIKFHPEKRNLIVTINLYSDAPTPHVIVNNVNSDESLVDGKYTFKKTVSV